MRRIYLIGALLTAFALGVWGGSLLTPAQGQTPPPTPQVASAVPYALPVYTYMQGRWQLFTILSPDRAQTLTILLDSNTGASYLLVPGRTARVPYTWERLDRTP